MTGRLAMRSGDWKLLMNNDGTNVELYNIVKDEKETTNLAEREPAITKQLKQKLMKWWNEMPRLQ